MLVTESYLEEKNGVRSSTDHQPQLWVADTQLAQAEAGKARETAESQGGHGFRRSWYKGSHTLPFRPFLGLFSSFLQPVQAGNRQLLLSPGRSPAIPEGETASPQNDTRKVPVRIVICWACIMTQALNQSLGQGWDGILGVAR